MFIKICEVVLFFGKQHNNLAHNGLPCGLVLERKWRSNTREDVGDK
jgi:hypothetical protein